VTENDAWFAHRVLLVSGLRAQGGRASDFQPPILVRGLLVKGCDSLLRGAALSGFPKRLIFEL
jgi:hypothetical protein